MAKEITEEEILHWFESTLLPELISKKKFGPDYDTVKSLQWEISERNTDHFASCPYFGVLNVQNKNGNQTKSIKFVAKFMPPSLAVRSAMDCELQFYNEMMFYNKVLPTFQKYLAGKPHIPKNYLSDICPECFYANVDLDNPDYGIVILNDLRQEKFQTSKEKVELDLDHCLLSIKKLAKFHAISYAMKIDQDQDDMLERLKTCYRECRFNDDDRFKAEINNHFFKVTGLRGISYLESLENSEVPLDYLNILRGKLESAYKLMQEMCVPEEPIAVLCHGDFCRNNILYRYEEDKVVDCKLFDYQTFRYSNPSIDLTFFIYMNTTSELRSKHFQEIFKIYYSSLIENIANISLRPVSEISNIYPLSLFQKDFADHSLYGYITVSFFLPLMLFPSPQSLEEEFKNLTAQEQAEKNVAQGGIAVTERLAEIVKEMYRNRCYIN